MAKKGPKAVQVTPEMIAYASEHVLNGGNQSGLAIKWEMNPVMISRLVKRTPELHEIFFGVDSPRSQPPVKPTPDGPDPFVPDDVPVARQQIRIPLLIDNRQKPNTDQNCDDEFRRWPFVLGILPEELREVFDNLTELHKAKLDAYATVEALPPHHRQHLFLYVYIETHFDTNRAMAFLTMTRDDLDHWLREYPEFNKIWRTVFWYKKNYFETCLIKACAAGKESAIIFANKTINHRRGYSDALATVAVAAEPAKTDTIPIDSLDLPIAVRLEIMNAMQKKRTEGSGSEKNHVMPKT